MRLSATDIVAQCHEIHCAAAGEIEKCKRKSKVIEINAIKRHIKKKYYGKNVIDMTSHMIVSAYSGDITASIAAVKTRNYSMRVSVTINRII
jgi:hypothetical protein